jgi:hypothetical protein
MVFYFIPTISKRQDVSKHIEKKMETENKKMNTQNKASITKILFKQAIESVSNAINANKINRIDNEVQHSINASLLLGIVLEGLINEIGELKLDKFTWGELERLSTPLKWKIISGLTSSQGFLPSEEPLQSVEKLRGIRNKIAHPKLLEIGNDVILSNDEIIKINPSDDFQIPNGDLNIYIGYQKLLKEYNSKDAYKNLANVFIATKRIIELFEIKNSFEWIEDIEDDLLKLKQQ